MVVSPNVGCFLRLNKQAPGNNSQIEDQNLTFLNSTDSSNKKNIKVNVMLMNDTCNGLCLCNGGTHTGIIISKVELTLR